MKRRYFVRIFVLVVALLALKPLFADETPAMEAFYRGVTALQEAAIKPTLPQRQRGWASAEKQFREAIELKHDYADAYNKLGQSLFNQSRVLEAIEEFRYATKIDPRLTEAWYGMGFAYENMDTDKRLAEDEKTKKKLAKTENKDAMAAYQKAIGITPA